MLGRLNKIARSRGVFVDKSEKGLLARANVLQNRLDSYIIKILVPSLDIKNGKIVNSAANLKRINKISGLKKFINEVINLSMYEYYDKQYRGLESRTTPYFDLLGATSKNDKKVIGNGKISIDGFLNSLFDNNDIARQLQSTIRTAINSNREVSELNTLLTEQIKGKDDKFGIIQSFHYNNGGYDSFQKYTRTLDEGFSKVLNLNYAIYAGGKIKTTREFCLSRSGKVFNRETIESWNNIKTWQGKIEGGDVLIDAGGYNCRHDYDWISYELAKRINTDIQKSTYDKK